jgi:hypothetical protein
MVHGPWPTSRLITMHTANPTIRRNHRHPAVRALASAALASLLMSACGGGGGGGGGDSAPGATSSSSGVPFPFGMTLASPAALGAVSAVVPGALGILDLGLNASTTPLQRVVSSQVDALATGRLALSGGSLLNLSALFDTSARGHAACQGPAVAYQNHDDAPGSNGTLPRGSVAMWSDTEINDTSLPCSVAELNVQTDQLSAQTNQAMLMMAALRYAVAANSAIRMPSPGQSVDLTPGANTLLTQLLGGIVIQNASVALNDNGSEYTYRLVLNQGSDATAQTLDITLLHTPAETDVRYAGVLQISQSYVSNDASIGCTDQRDSASRYKVSRLTSLGYNRQDQWLSLRARSGQYCGHAGNSDFGHAGQIAALTMSGELDPSAYLNGSTRGLIKGWRQGFVRMGTDLLMSSLTGDFVYAWQDQPAAGQGHARLMAGSSTLDAGTGVRTIHIHQGHTDDIAVTDGTLRGLICNAGGPGSTATVRDLYQTQSMTLAANATSWTLGASHIRHAPTNNCNASNAMGYDADGNGALAGAEGTGTQHDLAAPTGTRIDVQEEIIERGFLPPILLL